MKVYVGGVNGVGKTTVLQAFLQETGFPVKHATLEFLKYLGIPNDYSSLRALEDNYRETQLLSFMTELASSKESFILDSHYLIMINGVAKPVINTWIDKFDLLVYLHAPVEIVLSRLGSDKRERSLFSSGDLGKVTQELQSFVDETEQVFNQTVEEYNIDSLTIDTTQKLTDIVETLKDKVL